MMITAIQPKCKKGFRVDFDKVHYAVFAIKTIKPSPVYGSALKEAYNLIVAGLDVKTVEKNFLNVLPFPQNKLIFNL